MNPDSEKLSKLKSIISSLQSSLHNKYYTLTSAPIWEYEDATYGRPLEYKKYTTAGTSGGDPLYAEYNESDRQFILKVKDIAAGLDKIKTYDIGSQEDETVGENNNMPDLTEDEQEASVDNLNESVEASIPEYHRGTVDNPFIYDGTLYELEKFLLTIVFVAGKNATVQQKKVDQLIELIKRDIGSFSVEQLGPLSAAYNSLSEADLAVKINEWLTEVKSGQYKRLNVCISSLCTQLGKGTIDLRSCTRAQLNRVKGIGYKSASMFLMFSRNNWAGACLDTHILKYMRDEMKVADVPNATPSSKYEYLNLENQFLAHAKSLNMKPAELDFMVWSQYRKKEKEAPPVAKE
jgi:hypothetical protein